MVKLSNVSGVGAGKFMEKSTAIQDQAKTIEVFEDCTTEVVWL
jgi:hypothetical protein